MRVYLPPLESGTPTTYCSRALEFQTPLIFNEVFRIPVHSSVLKLKSLQLYICSVDHQQQEELLVSGPLVLFFFFLKLHYMGNKDLEVISKITRG